MLSRQFTTVPKTSKVRAFTSESAIGRSSRQTGVATSPRCRASRVSLSRQRLLCAGEVAAAFDLFTEYDGVLNIVHDPHKGGMLVRGRTDGIVSGTSWQGARRARPNLKARRRLRSGR